MELTLSKFFFDTPIYTIVQFDDSNNNLVEEIFGWDRVEFEGYNPWKQSDSTFKVASGASERFMQTGGHQTLTIKCKRYDSLFYYYILWNPRNMQIIKTGQDPSVADFHQAEIKQYRKLLTVEKLGEFNRAIGLAAHGVGIGSFVYLRRIFEHLIGQAYDICLVEKVVTEAQYKQARMDEKIQLLASHLPDFLVENRKMYSILSMGIHDLDEATCLEYFDTLRVGIEIILDEKLEEIKKQEKHKAANIKISELAARMEPQPKDK